MAKKVAPKTSERASVVHLKGTPDYREWLAGISKKTYIPSATIVRLALAEWAQKHKHPAPPER